MKILQLCNRVPFPPLDGGSLAICNLTKAFIDAGHSISMAVLDPSGRDTSVGKKYHGLASFYSVPVDTSVHVSGAIRTLLTGKSYNVTRFISREFTRLLKEVLVRENPDVVQVEGLYMSPYIETIRENSSAKIVLRTHNVEHRIWKQMSGAAFPGLKKIYLGILARRLKVYEEDRLNLSDAIIPITPLDEVALRELGCRVPMHTAAFGINVAEYIPSGIMDIPSVFHLGAMDWKPNAEGVKWFLEKVWPDVHSRMPGLKLHLGGKGMPSGLLKKAPPGVVVTGAIADARQYMASRQIMIVPLLSGGGMRVKIIEGMAMGKAIISTPVGCEGISCTPGKDILVAATPAELAEKIIHCASNPDFCLAIGKNARTLAENEYNNRLIAARLLGFYEKLISR